MMKWGHVKIYTPETMLEALQKGIALFMSSKDIQVDSRIRQMMIMTRVMPSFFYGLCHVGSQPQAGWPFN
jgi:hypothetical protein